MFCAGTHRRPQPSSQCTECHKATVTSSGSARPSTAPPLPGAVGMSSTHVPLHTLEPWFERSHLTAPSATDHLPEAPEKHSSSHQCAEKGSCFKTQILVLGQTGLGELGCTTSWVSAQGDTDSTEIMASQRPAGLAAGWDGASDLNCEEQTLCRARICADSTVISQLIAAATQQDHG